jgi:hypothetical protein
MGEPARNDPQWVAWPAEHIDVFEVGDKQPGVGVGGYRCNGCDLAHVSVAIFRGPIQMEALLAPDDAYAYATTILAKLEALGYERKIN